MRHGFSGMLLAVIMLSAAVAPGHAANTKVPQAVVAQGILEGTQNGAIKIFLGVPFAAPPVGTLRWAPPQPAIPWTGVRSAKSFGSRCMQGRVYPDMSFRDPGISEDCLTLNIWTPAKSARAKLPVMVWFFGGGFVAGGTSEPRQDGANLAKNGGVVVVTLNYRLGIFGFLAHPALAAESSHHAAGNYGLLDQTAALQWVRQNIAAFGGDPRNVTIFGESAGSASVGLQMASPLAKGLFERAIGESGGIAPRPIFRWSSEDRRVSRQMQKYWVHFARNGNPNAPGLHAWPAYNASSGWQVLHLDDAVSVSPDAHRERYLLLDRLSTAASTSSADKTTAFDPNPWIEDLREIRSALSDKYANFEWVVFEREIELADLFARAEARLRDAPGDEAAKAIIDRLTRALGDGHVRVRWPGKNGAGIASAPPAHASVCPMLGYDAAMSGAALGPHIPGYQPLPDDIASAFPAGMLVSAGQRVGIIRIGLFAPEGSPELCASALKALSIAPDATCDQQCADRVTGAAYGLMSRDLAMRIRALKRLGATTLLVDLTGNGGGSEWAEAAVRIVSPLSLRSERLDFVRGEHWAHNWESIAQDLRQAQNDASAADKANLEHWAQQADRAKAEASARCSSTPFWSGRPSDCPWLGRGFYATGILGEADAADLRKKPWGSLVFSPAEYDFEAAVWHGPLLVLVDGYTGSAAEEFAAVLQDNKAAIVIGAPTVGAGCGHTNGGTPTTLSHSGGVLELPDCARIRLDGTNEVNGIDPDIVIGFRSADSLRRKGLRLASALPQGITAAARLCTQQNCESRGARRAAHR